MTSAPRWIAAQNTAAAAGLPVRRRRSAPPSAWTASATCVSGEQRAADEVCGYGLGSAELRRLLGVNCVAPSGATVACVEGSAVDCGESLSACGLECADTSSDPLRCGGCVGIPATRARRGARSASAPMTVREASPTALARASSSIDSAVHCGGCGMACPMPSGRSRPAGLRLRLRLRVAAREVRHRLRGHAERRGELRHLRRGVRRSGQRRGDVRRRRP